jgi:hypothetical protein
VKYFLATASCFSNLRLQISNCTSALSLGRHCCHLSLEHLETYRRPCRKLPITGTVATPKSSVLKTSSPFDEAQPGVILHRATAAGSATPQSNLPMVGLLAFYAPHLWLCAHKFESVNDNRRWRPEQPQHATGELVASTSMQREVSITPICERRLLCQPHVVELAAAECDQSVQYFSAKAAVNRNTVELKSPCNARNLADPLFILGFSWVATAQQVASFQRSIRQCSKV